MLGSLKSANRNDKHFDWLYWVSGEVDLKKASNKPMNICVIDSAIDFAEKMTSTINTEEIISFHSVEIFFDLVEKESKSIDLVLVDMNSVQSNSMNRLVEFGKNNPQIEIAIMTSSVPAYVNKRDKIAKLGKFPLCYIQKPSAKGKLESLFQIATSKRKVKIIKAENMAEHEMERQ
jgi:DNA-binding NtrC family response regulator